VTIEERAGGGGGEGGDDGDEGGEGGEGGEQDGCGGLWYVKQTCLASEPPSQIFSGVREVELKPHPAQWKIDVLMTGVPGDDVAVTKLPSLYRGSIRLWLWLGWAVVRLPGG